MEHSESYQATRRTFLATTITALSALGLPEWYTAEAIAAERERDASLPQRIAPNDEIHVAIIGPGGSRGGFRQGLGDTRAIASQPGVRCVAVCDVDALHAQEAAKTFNLESKDIYKDYRELLRRKDIDAVVIGTPDHWHAQICIDAMKAGKDVFCEKPLTLTIDEGKKIVATWRSKKRIFQTGSQQRSDGRFRYACELVRNGRLGKLSTVKANLPGGNVGGPFAVKDVPADLDWDMWLGPAPWEEYIYERTHGSFRHWLEYSGGMMTDWGAHHNDIAQWGLGMDASGPIAIEAQGKRTFGRNSFNAFQEYKVTYTYANGVTLTSSHQGENGVQFEGENGWIFVSRGTIRASDPKLLEEPLPSNATRLYVSNNHYANFVDCVRKRDRQPICDAQVGHRSVSVCHLGNICLREGGRRLEWDPEKEEFVNDKVANTYLSRPRRGKWRI